MVGRSRSMYAWRDAAARACSTASSSRCDGLPQGHAGAVRTQLRRAHRRPHPFRRLPERESFLLEEPERLALVLWQPLQLPLEVESKVAQLGALLRRDAHGGCRDA